MAAEELLKYQRIVIDQDTCISCGACVSVCPAGALELDEETAKARLLWDKCVDDFSCIDVCPVYCIYKTSEAPDEHKAKDGWYRFSRDLSEEEKQAFEQWKQQYGVTGNPA